MEITAQMVKELREKTGAGMMDCKKALTEVAGNMDAAMDWLREKGISKAAKKADRVAAEGLCAVATAGNRAVVFELNSETDFVAKNSDFLALLQTVGTALVTSEETLVENALNIACGNTTVGQTILEASAVIGEKFTLRRVQFFSKSSGQTFGGYTHMGGKIVALTILNGTSEAAATDVAMHVAAINPTYKDQSEISEEVVAKEKGFLMNEALAEGKPAEIVEKMVIGRLNKYLKDMCLVNQPFVKNPDQTVEQYLKSADSDVVCFVRLEVGEGIEKQESDFAAEVMSQVRG